MLCFVQNFFVVSNVPTPLFSYPPIVDRDGRTSKVETRVQVKRPLAPLGFCLRWVDMKQKEELVRTLSNFIFINLIPRIQSAQSRHATPGKCSQDFKISSSIACAERTSPLKAKRRQKGHTDFARYMFCAPLFGLRRRSENSTKTAQYILQGSSI
jgi:hypothetical protein